MKHTQKNLHKKVVPNKVAVKQNVVTQNAKSENDAPQINVPQVSFAARVKHSVKRRSKLVVKNLLLSRMFHTVSKVLFFALLIGLVSYGLYRHFNARLENDVVVSKSEIVDRVSKLTKIPKGEPEAVVRVQDPEVLRKQNEFYSDVKEGDYILMYPSAAIIYDLRNNTIISEKRSEK